MKRVIIFCMIFFLIFSSVSNYAQNSNYECRITNTIKISRIATGNQTLEVNQKLIVRKIPNPSGDDKYSVTEVFNDPATPNKKLCTDASVSKPGPWPDAEKQISCNYKDKGRNYNLIISLVNFGNSDHERSTSCINTLKHDFGLSGKDPDNIDVADKECVQGMNRKYDCVYGWKITPLPCGPGMECPMEGPGSGSGGGGHH